MKNSRIRAAAAGVLTLAAGHAFALNSGDITGTEVKLYFSGATATDNAFANMAKLISTQGICQAGTLDFYSYAATAGGTVTQRLAFCTANANAGTGMNGKKIAVFKESAAGSANGIVPVADAATKAFLPFSVAGLGACETASSTSVGATGDFAAYTQHDCTSTTVPTLANVVPNAGVSDIDPKTFVGLGGVTASHAANLLSTSTVGVTFNPIVSVALYRALQTAQGLTTDDTLANVPTLTLAQLRGIFSGTVTNGNQLYSYRNSTGAQVQVSAASKTMYVCRRGNTSGTMASFKILFLGEGCSKNPASIGSFVKPVQVYQNAGEDENGDPVGTNPIDQETGGQAWSSTIALFNAVGSPISNGYGGIRVFGGAGSGDVRSCMGFHSDANDYAIGTASTESRPNLAAVNTHWRFVKVEGAEPTLKATMEGRYPYFTENTFNRQAQSGAGNFLAAASDPLNLYNGIVANIGKPLVLANINSQWIDAAATGTVGTGEGDTGILDIPTATNNLSVIPVTAASVRIKPVNSQVRTYTGAANNCNMSKQFYP